MKRTLLLLGCLIGCDLTLGASLQKETGKLLYHGFGYREADAVWQECRPGCTMTFEAGAYRVIDGSLEELGLK